MGSLMAPTEACWAYATPSPSTLSPRNFSKTRSIPLTTARNNPLFSTSGISFPQTPIKDCNFSASNTFDNDDPSAPGANAFTSAKSTILVKSRTFSNPSLLRLNNAATTADRFSPSPPKLATISANSPHN
eukprot:CCRYP_015363-RB/>CCRYP_015363-RB protein AED:0.48 eAED:1.00 QI:0/0/0/1/0/0/2/0/129